jgi:hypothetical protein
MIIVCAFNLNTGHSISVLASTDKIAAGFRAFIVNCPWLRFDGIIIR